MNSLSVIIPFYNEEEFLEESLERVLEENIFNQVILSDDCSNDGSSEIAIHYSEKYKNIIYIKSEQNLGKGNALNNAKALVTSSHVIIHDADLEYFPNDVVEMFDIVKEHPNSLILGSRFIGVKNRKNIYLRTYFANKIMSLFFSVVNFYYVSDVATCYKLMPTSFFKNLDIKEKGFSIEIEIISKFLKYNKSIIEAPIGYEGRSYEQGKKIKSSDGFLYIFNTLRYRFFN